MSTTTRPRASAQMDSGRSGALDALLEMAGIALRSTPTDQILSPLVQVLKRRCGLRGYFIMTTDDSQDPGEFQRTFSKPLNRRIRQVAASVIRQGQPVILARIDDQFPVRSVSGPATESNGAQDSLICVPILSGRRTNGALGLLFPFRESRDYDRDLQLSQLVAFLIGQTSAVSGQVVGHLKQREEVKSGLLRQEKDRFDFSNMIGTSSAMQQVFEQIARVSRAGTTVLIRGDSGTGKELVADAIHDNSLRSQQPFVKVHCAALPRTLIESELFGYEKGAFTDAFSRKEGRFQAANGGTLFLDEVGELDLPTQAKLLRVLQTRDFERLGGTRTIKVDVRLIAATNKDLEKAIKKGKFREDLYYRLNVFTIFVPPLRERKGDILLLADHFLEKYAQKQGKDIRRISTRANDMLMSYLWPGNVRELENAIERAVLMCDGPVIHGYHLPPPLQTAETSGAGMSLSLDQAVAQYEKGILYDVLKTTGGNRSQAARLLHTSKRVIGYKVKKYEIDCSLLRAEKS